MSTKIGLNLSKYYSINFSLPKRSSKKIKFIDPPYIRFEGEDIEQETMFLEDPNGNCMEIKTMKNPNTLFKK